MSGFIAAVLGVPLLGLPVAARPESKARELLLALLRQHGRDVGSNTRRLCGSLRRKRGEHGVYLLP